MNWRAVPIKTKPFEGPKNDVDEFWTRAFGIGVFDPENELATLLTGKEPVEKGGSGTANMEIARWGRGEADSGDWGAHRLDGTVRPSFLWSGSQSGPITGQDRFPANISLGAIMNWSAVQRRFRPFAIVAMSLALVLGAASCSSDKNSSSDNTSQESSSTTALTPYQTTYATAKGSKLTVLSELPKSVVTTPSSSTSSSSTTTTPKVPAIPRNGLNSAGVKKTADGYEFTNPTYYKNPLVVVVLENQGEYMKVLLTARPNHTTGWIKADDVTIAATEFRMELDLSTYHLKVFKGAEVFIETDVVIGKDATPTPLGRFFVTEKIKNSTDTGVYGAWILPTNGYSEVLDTFDGGLPQVAFHGTNQPELVGTKASNGCVRIPNETVIKIAEAIPAGTPIDIFPTTPDSWSAKSTGSSSSIKS